MISVFNDFDAFHFKAPDLGIWLEILLFPIYTEKRLWDSDSFGTDPLRVGSDLLGNAPICPRGTPIGSDWAFWGLFRAIWPRRRPSQQTLPLPAESVPSGYSSAQNVDLYKKFYIADFLRKRVRMGGKVTLRPNRPMPIGRGDRPLCTTALPSGAITGRRRARAHLVDPAPLKF